MDNTFWAFASLVAFLGVVWYFKGFPRMGQALDGHATRVRRELEEARQLRDEAKAQLADYQRRRAEAETEAAGIVAAAQCDADALLLDARRRNEDYVARRTKMAELKIAQAEADAVAEVKASAVDIAIAAASRILTEKGGNGEANRLTEQSLGEIRQRLH